MSTINTPVDNKLTALQRHGAYYLPGGDLYFLVENYHFRVHRYFFERESSFFQDQLATPASPGESSKGRSESSAVVLDNVKSTDFEHLLWVFYNPKYSLYDTTIEQWSSILELAHRWSFNEVKALAIRELEKMAMSDIDRIVLYHKYEIDRKILIPRYASLCAREHSLTYEEGVQLGLQTALLIARARECARCKATDSGARTPVPSDFKEDDMKSLITDLFELQPAPAAAQPNTENLASGSGGATMNGHANGAGTSGTGANGAGAAGAVAAGAGANGAGSVPDGKPNARINEKKKNRGSS